jgi:serine/threonine-protein kinase RsbT
MTEGVVHDFEHRVSVRDESDLVVARRLIRTLARREGMPDVSVEALATAITELARNILAHAISGEILLGVARKGSVRGVVVVSRDDGPGIDDIAKAMTDGFSSAGGLGLGLSSVQRMADDFELQSVPGTGTTITLRKWCP